MVPMFINALFEFVQCGILPVFACIYGRSSKQLVKSRFHPSSDIGLHHTLIALVDGVSEKVNHILAPGIVRKGPHRIGEVLQQVSDAYLVVIHHDFVHEVGRPAVCAPDPSALLLLGKVLVHHFVASALVKGDLGRNFVLKGSQLVVLAADVDPRLVCPSHLAACNFLPDHLIWSLRELPHSIQYAGDGTLADVKSEDGLIQVREPFERDVLVGAEIRSLGHDVGTIGHQSVDVLMELPPCNSGRRST